MEKKYTRKQIEEALTIASTKAIEKDINDLKQIDKKKEGEVDIKFLTANSLKNIMFVSELQEFFMEELDNE